MLKPRLFAPGPVEVPPAVLEAMARPVMHHRSAEFRALFDRVRNGLARIMCVPGDEVLVVTGSGTAAFEAALLTAVPAGAKVLAVSAGKFGERWAEMAERFGYRVVPLALPWGSAVDPTALAGLLGEHPDAEAVITTHSETSTGVLHDVAALAAVARRQAPDILVLVDAVTSLGATELRPREWGLDVVVSGSQKGLMTPPGLGFAWLSERAWERRGARAPSYYLDLRRERRKQAGGESAYTPAVSLLAGLDAALRMLEAEGVEEVWARRELLNAAVLAGGKAIGLTPFAERPSPAVAALEVPASVAAPDVVKQLERRGVRIAGGQDRLKVSLLRPSLLGYADRFDAIALTAALEEALRGIGLDVPHGQGVAAAMRYLESA